MTKLLNSAFEEISKLPEIESEKKWEKILRKLIKKS